MDQAAETVEVVAVEKVAISEFSEKSGKLTKEGTEYLDLIYLNKTEEIWSTGEVVGDGRHLSIKASKSNRNCDGEKLVE